MILIVILGRGAGLLSIPPLCLRRILGQMDRSTGQDGFPGGYDVPPGIANEGLDRERH